MRRIFSVVLVFLVALLPSLTAMGQQRDNLPTQSQRNYGVSAPSFRGGYDGSMKTPQQGNAGVPGVSALPGALSGGTDGGSGGEMMVGAMGYQVHVLGEVARPGTYKIAASERVSEAIERAGGITENGSERRIELRRKGRGVIAIDFLGFTMYGRLDDNPYLTDNDVVYVPLRDKVVQVVGSVKRPGVYELRDEKNLFSVIELAGGFNAATYMSDPIKIIRFKDGEKTVEDVAIQKEAMLDFAVQSGDVIIAPNVVTKATKFDYNVASIPGDQIFYPSYEDRVFILGGVASPGAYPFSPYYTLNQYISLAGGITDRGAPKYKVISIDGKRRKAGPSEYINPGDTVMVKEHWMSPASWIAFVMGVASFGLSTTATVLALTRR